MIFLFGRYIFDHKYYHISNIYVGKIALEIILSFSTKPTENFISDLLKTSKIGAAIIEKYSDPANKIVCWITRNNKQISARRRGN